MKISLFQPYLIWLKSTLSKLSIQKWIESIQIWIDCCVRGALNRSYSKWIEYSIQINDPKFYSKILIIKWLDYMSELLESIQIQ